MPDEPTLFDVPQQPVSAPAPRVERGRARQTWKRTVTVDIEVVRADTVRRLALRVLNRQPSVELRLRTDAPDPRAEIHASPRAALQWVIDPTRGFEDLLDTGAVRLIEAGVRVEELSERANRATWYTTIKLGDVAAVRRFAAEQVPGEQPDNAAPPSFPEVWNAAVDAYAPVRGLSGITWNARGLACEVMRRKAPAKAE
jgi:hypothetical protein